jgi:hypothetical protein
LQCTFMMLKKLMSVRDLNLIMKDFSLADSKEQLFRIYDYCVNGSHTDFLFVDLNAPEEKRFRRNFHEILNIDDFAST